MDEARATPDEFDLIREVARPPLPARRRPLLTMRDVRRGVLISIGVIVGLVVLLYGLAALMFAPYYLAHSSNPRDYPRLLQAFQEHHRQNADFLPPAIPAGATEITLDANTRSMFQAEPFLRLSFKLGPVDAAAELARLEAAGPVDSFEESFPPAHLWDRLNVPVQTWTSFKFTSEGSRVWANAWHEPDTGRFFYELTSD